MGRPGGLCHWRSKQRRALVGQFAPSQRSAQRAAVCRLRHRINPKLDKKETQHIFDPAPHTWPIGGIISGLICQSVKPDLQRPGPISGVGALVETIEADKGRVMLDLQHRPRQHRGATPAARCSHLTVVGTRRRPLWWVWLLSRADQEELP